MLSGRSLLLSLISNSCDSMLELTPWLILSDARGGGLKWSPFRLSSLARDGTGWGGRMVILAFLSLCACSFFTDCRLTATWWLPRCLMCAGRLIFEPFRLKLVYVFCMSVCFMICCWMLVRLSCTSNEFYCGKCRRFGFWNTSDSFLRFSYGVTLPSFPGREVLDFLQSSGPP